MSTGGVFQLITNDGRQDEMLLATSMLNANLANVKAANIAAGKADPEPTISDLQRTHIYHLKASFKPMVALAFEYQPTTAQSAAQFGAELVFSLQVFGEFINDLVVVVEIDAVSANNAAFWTVPGLTASGNELISYVNHPGHRIFTRATFEVNGNILDDYTPDIVNYHYKFFVTKDKQIAWDRLMGQETPKYGYSPVASTSLSPNLNYRAAGVRQLVSFTNGPQTPKPTQPKLIMVVPLLFWFCQDPASSLASVALPYGQRFVKLPLCAFPDLVQHHHAFNMTLDNPTANPITQMPTVKANMYANNIFVNNPVHDIVIKSILFQMNRFYRYQRQRETNSPGRELLQNFKWPIEQIYTAFQPVTNADPANPVRGDTWNQYGQYSIVNVNEGSLSNGYHWGTFLPTTNIPASTYNTAFETFTGLTFDFGAVLGVPDTTVLTVSQVNTALTLSGYPPLNAYAFANPVTPTATEIVAATPLPFSTAYYFDYKPTITRLTYVAQSILLQPNLNAHFYNSYMPWTYIDKSMRCPEDPGAYLTTFALYPGQYQPSGYINVSRAREFYVEWESDYISTGNPVTLITVAIAFNFLLISDGSAVLRFAT
jgi:hypothetical protein